MNQLKTTKAEVEWSEEGNGVSINIKLPETSQFSSFLRMQADQESKEVSTLESNLRIDGIFVRNGSRFDKILFKDILYFEAQGAYTVIYTKSKPYTLSRNLTRCCKGLTYPFMRVHRSYTVNLENIDAFSEANVFYKEKRIPVSESYRKELLTYFNRI